MSQRPAIALLRDLIAAWPDGLDHWPTADIVPALRERYADRWGPTDKYAKGLTAQRLGRYLGKTWGLRSSRPTAGSERDRGYFHAEVLALATRAGLAPPVTGQTGQTAQTGQQQSLSVTGQTGQSDLTDPCRRCGNPLLLKRPGRDTCAKCAKEDPHKGKAPA